MTQKQTWACPSCSNKITTLVTLSEPPVCSKHIKGGRVMIEVTKGAKDE